ncbi:MAG: enoyl-CoA hydratase/isomerase family protein [archaeon]|nr:enoyl-CoA hydratase/isomerase family protein [archaeon]
MEYKNLIVERRGHIAIVTLNRPEKLNTLNSELRLEIEQVTEEFHKDIETRVVIFTGAGKYFCGGVDLTESLELTKDSITLLEKRRTYESGPRMIRKIFEMEQITIAAINKGTYGGGACIAAACDFRIGTDDCTVGYTESGLGMSLAWMSLPLCVHLIGPSRAKQMVITGKKIDAKTLLNWGFLDEIVLKENILKRALEMAEEYAQMPPIAAQMIKKSINNISSALDRSIMHMDGDQLLFTLGTEDLKEGITAFFRKRKGTYKGN